MAHGTTRPLATVSTLTLAVPSGPKPLRTRVHGVFAVVLLTIDAGGHPTMGSNASTNPRAAEESLIVFPRGAFLRGLLADAQRRPVTKGVLGCARSG
jgi:hypothetical protein